MLQPLKNKVLIRLDGRKQQEGLIHIPASAQRAETWGEVIATGESCEEIEKGHRVLVLPTQGTHYTQGGADMIILEEPKILAVEETKRRTRA